jgi:hypothetical protein
MEGRAPGAIVQDDKVYLLACPTHLTRMSSVAVVLVELEYSEKFAMLSEECTYT